MKWLLLGFAVAMASACDEADGPPLGVCGDGTCSFDESSASCAVDCSVGCGNGVCSNDESSNTCPADCAAAACTVPEPASCAGDTICVNQTCVPAYGRVYTIQAHHGEIAPLMFDGSSWDAAGGAPDPFCTVTLNGQVLFTTAAVADELAPFWSEEMAVEILAGSELRIECADEDLTADDRILGCAVSLTPDVLHAREYRCDEDGSWVVVYLDT